MSNLIFSLNATMPIFLTMILGLFFRKVGILDESFTSKMNKFVFKIALPVLLFQDLSDSDFSAVWDIKFVLFCFFATLLSILAVWGLSHLLKERSARGEFIQAAYRSSAAILGIAFIQNIYGNSGMAPLMIISSVPLYNIMAVVVLAVFRPEREEITNFYCDHARFASCSIPSGTGGDHGRFCEKDGEKYRDKPDYPRDRCRTSLVGASHSKAGDSAENGAEYCGTCNAARPDCDGCVV